MFVDKNWGSYTSNNDLVTNYLEILFVKGAFVTQNLNITIAEGQYAFHVNCTRGCEQKRVLID